MALVRKWTHFSLSHGKVNVNNTELLSGQQCVYVCVMFAFFMKTYNVIVSIRLLTV